MNSSENGEKIFSKSHLREIVNNVSSSSIQIDDDFVDLINIVAESFLEKTAIMSLETVQLRHTDALKNAKESSNISVEPTDLQIPLEKLWDMKLPGTLLDTKEPTSTTNARKIRRIAGYDQKNASVVLNHHARLEAARQTGHAKKVLSQAESSQSKPRPTKRKAQ